ncbi:sulfotransferase [Nonomuraea sp. B19D2]|uniref:sulfotransferase family protein n=1 Tax=Nonomuraea sp. B19D2 TaxID=3159561 RepID=UPI0032DAD56E
MSWRYRANTTLEGLTGYTLTRRPRKEPPKPPPPPPLVLQRLPGDVVRPPVDPAHDRLLHRELTRSGKPILAEKTPSNVFIWRRISACWPDARFVFLLRHPMSIVQSWHEADPDKRPMEEAVPRTLSYMTYLEEARIHLDGLTMRYEELVAEPERELRRLCLFLGLEFEPAMLNYGAKDHGAFVKGIGDWRDKIRAGTVVEGRPLPAADEVPDELREMCRLWDY